jgi:haloacid dehalogenase superfamily, subfamily IA, variant 3 with third motif having DD or ED/haloacid dehalogenase superfamily, subfamily IA, variant 1 with third motif having Dx(3-4)D or Dx(3-4)E
MRKIKAVVFDLDNTLVDFMRMKRSAVRAAAEAMVGAGLKMTPDEVYNEVFKIYEKEGIEDQFVFNKLLEKVLGRVDWHILAAGVVAYRRAKEANLTPYPFVKQTLVELLRRGYKLAVVSDAPRLQAWTRLVESSLDQFFDAVVTYEDTFERKPAAAPFKKALELLGISDPRESVMVGDWAERDVLGAKAIGMITVFARYGDTFGTVNSGADFEINSPIELLEILDKIT